MSKRRAFFMQHIGCIIVLGIFCSFLPVGGIETLCRAQADSPEQAARMTAAKPGQTPATTPNQDASAAVPAQMAGPREAPSPGSPPALNPEPARSRFPVPPAPVPGSRRGQFTLNFDDADVYTIIQTVFGEILKFNYVVDPRVKGRVTFRAIAPVPAENVLPLMEVILRLNGIGIVEDNGLYRIIPIGEISKEPSPVSYGRNPEAIRTTGKALLQVVPIVNIKSSEALKLITPFVSQNAVLIDVPRGNQIIIVDTDANVKRLLRLIEVFDSDNLKQRKPQVFVYQVKNGTAKDIASILQQIFTGGKGSAASAAATPARTGTGSPSPSTPPSAPAPSVAPASAQPQAAATPGGGESIAADAVKIISDDITNTVVILCTPEDYDAIAKAIEQIDIVPRQVIIEGMIASVSLTDNLSLGLARLFKQSYSGYSTSIGINAAGLSTSAAQAGFTFLATDPTGAAIALISGLAVESKAKVLAAPHILVSDNRDARIQVGQQVPLLTSETYGAVGVTPQRNYQYKDIGIILKVKPRINEGGLVSLDVSQEISTADKVSLGGAEQLLLNKTEAATNLVVQDGQTIVIGGLIREDTSKSNSGVPWLSRIPLIGWLFGSWSDDKGRQELIILLTPRVIKNQKDAKGLSSEFIENMSESSKGRIKVEELIKERSQQVPEGARPPRGAGNTGEPKP